MGSSITAYAFRRACVAVCLVADAGIRIAAITLVSTKASIGDTIMSRCTTCSTL